MHHGLLRNSLVCILPAGMAVGVIAELCTLHLVLDPAYLPKTVAVFVAGAAVVLLGLPRHHPFVSFGAANQVTLGRGMLVALLTGLIGERSSTDVAVLAVTLATTVAVLDGVDGWLARRTRMTSAFGARFDMEMDAALILVLAVLAWQFGRTGAWVLFGGLLRYAFVLAGWLLPWLRQRLPPSRRRRTMAVVQMVALIATLAPFVPSALAAPVAASGLMAVSMSFLLDILWLLHNASQARANRLTPVKQPTALRRYRLWQAARVVLAVVLLNAAVTFHNVWPTLGVHWPGELSVEVAALLLVLALTNARIGPTPRAVIAVLSVIIVLFALGRYADVTVSALYGRDINLYWDAPQFAAVTGMLARVASGWTIAAVGVGAAVVLGVLYLSARWALLQIDDTLRMYAAARWGFGAAGLVLCGCFIVQHTSEVPLRLPRFSLPVSRTYAAQIKRVVDAVSGRANAALPPSPGLHSSLAALDGNDVLLVFMESYGSATYDRPEFERALQPARERLQAAIHDTGRGVVSAFVSSPTFGGGSVLAHLSLLSGVEVRDQDRYALLMTQKRPTLVSVFKGAGYRTVAVMPGLREAWPEGAFYGFDRIFGADDLEYHGPGFGWWRIPDQFSLAALDARELQPRPRKPLFVFFPTVSTHMPFEPTPPLQPNWQRLLSAQPFDAAPLRRALTQTPEWTDMGKAYVSSVSYFLDTLSSFLRARPDDRFVLIILGDHQPAANVSGEGASWDVPVHVIAGEPAILQSLQADGFRAGLEPVRPTAGRMSELGPWALTAFGQGGHASRPRLALSSAHAP